MDPIETARTRRRFVYFLLFAFATGFIAFAWMRNVALEPEMVRAAVTDWGILAPVVYIGLLCIRPLFLFPSALLFIAGGLAFGPILGTLYAAVGGTLGGVVTFLIARALGREFVQGRLPPRLREFQKESWGAGLVFLLNLVPIIPITAVNYAAGLSKITLAHYTLAAAGGLTPRAFAYSFFGHSLVDVGTPQLLLAVGLLLLLVVVPTWLRHRVLGQGRGGRSKR